MRSFLWRVSALIIGLGFMPLFVLASLVINVSVAVAKSAMASFRYLVMVLENAFG
jgi:hypothetical protein